MTKGVGSPWTTVQRRTRETKRAMTHPLKVMLNMIRGAVRGKKAWANMRQTGTLAPQVMNGAVRMVARRSLGLRRVRVGTDGLIIAYGRASGLLLPQVAIEWNFTPQTFLEAVCEKAGLPKDMWKSASAKLWTFQAQVFAESVEVTGVVLTKLDGSAKGGIVIAIREELGIPIKLIGVGERLEDLRPFDPDEFARALFLDDAPAGP